MNAVLSPLFRVFYEYNYICIVRVQTSSSTIHVIFGGSIISALPRCGSAGYRDFLRIRIHLIELILQLSN